MRQYVFLIGIAVSTFAFPSLVAYAQIDLSGSSLAGGVGATQQTAAIAPSPVDILVDSDSYVPPFYRGRALPSAGTNIRLVAVPYFKNSDGSYVPSSNIIFTWKQDDRVVGTVSGLGKSSVVLPAALLYGTTDIEVDAQSADNTSFGSATMVMPSVEPAIILYEDNPLLGLVYNRAISSNTTITDTEMTFAAVPYFAQIQSPNDSHLAYTWTVNDLSVRPDSQNPSEITLNSKNSSGAASLGLSLTQTNNIFMSSNSSWNMTLGTAESNAFNGSGGGAKDPFTGQTP